MKSRRARWSIALLAVLLNLGGGPVAWAHWLEAAAPQDTAMPEECAAHATPTDAMPDPGAMPCCEGGECNCAAPPAMAAIAPATLAVLPATPPRSFDIPALPPHPLDDSLRPPIR